MLGLCFIDFQLVEPLNHLVGKITKVCLTVNNVSHTKHTIVAVQLKGVILSKLISIRYSDTIDKNNTSKLEILLCFICPPPFYNNYNIELTYTNNLEMLKKGYNIGEMDIDIGLNKTLVY